jgi:tripeptidyl-peptidase-1
LINDARLNIGKGPVGFVKPTPYANPWVPNDITDGNNNACAGKGFNATNGWDRVTGLGTLNFPKMFELFLALP